MAWMDAQTGAAPASKRPRFRRTGLEPVEIKLVVFDLAGTVIDHGSLAPTEAFVETFRTVDVELTAEEAKAPMGLDKLAHIRALLGMETVAQRFQAVHGREAREDDVLALYERFIPHQLEAIARRATLIPGALETLRALRERGIEIATTTGYFRAAADRVRLAMHRQGFEADASICADDVAHARPAPWMLFAAMQALDVFPPAAVVKVGDTPYDIEEGLNAGAWAIGVARSGSLIGLAEEAWEALEEDDRRARLAEARERLLRAGAHRVIDAIADLPRVLDLL